MNRINTLSDLLMEELAELFNIEYQLVQALPKMAQACQSSALKTVLEGHGGVTKIQAGRLQDIFSNIGQNPQAVICRAMKDFIGEGEYVMKELEKSTIRDTAIISVMQAVEKYEITGYRRACEHAADLGHTRIVELLSETLIEERAMNLHLNELAQLMINDQAIDPSPKAGSGGFYIPKGKFNRNRIKRKRNNTDLSRFISEGNPNSQDPQER